MKFEDALGWYESVYKRGSIILDEKEYNALMAEARNSALDEAARECVNTFVGTNDGYDAKLKCKDAILSLRDKPSQPKGTCGDCGNGKRGEETVRCVFNGYLSYQDPSYTCPEWRSK